MQMLDSYATNFDSSTHCAKRDLDIATDIATHTDLEDSFRGEDAIEYVGDFFNDDEIARFDANIDEFMKNTAESLPTSAGTDGVASHMAHLPADKQTHHSRDTVEKEIDHSRSSIPVNGLSSKVDLEKDATQPANSANSPSLPSRIIKTRPLQLKKSRSSGVSVDPSMRESLFKDIEPGEICLPAKLAKSNDVELEKRIELVQSPAVKLRVLSPLSTPDAKSRSSDIHKKNPDSSFARADAFKSRKSKSYGTPRPESRRDSRYSPLPIRSAPRRKEKYDPKNSAYIPKPSSDHFSKHSYRSSASTPCTCKCAKHCSTSLDVSYEKKRENYADDEYIRKPKYISSTLKDKSSRKNDRDYYDRYDKKITSSRSDDRHFKDDIREKPKSTRKSYPVVKYSNEDATYDRRDYNSKSASKYDCREPERESSYRSSRVEYAEGTSRSREKSCTDKYNHRTPEHDSLQRYMSKQPSYPTNLSQQINQTQYQQPRLEPQRAGFDFNLSQYGNDINRFSGNNDAIMNGFTGQLQNMHPERSANMVDTNMSKGLVSCQPTTMGYSNIGNDNRQMNGGTAFPGNTYGIGNVFNSVNYSEQSATQQLDFNTLLSSESVKSAIDWLTTSNSALKLNSDDVIPDFCMNDAIGYAETHGLGIEVDSGFASLPPVAAPPAPLPKIRKIKKAPIKERAQYKRHATKDPINDQLLAIERLADARKHKRAAMLEKAMAMQNGALERASEQITRPARSQKARSYFTHTALESSTTMSENRNEVAEVIKKPRHAAAPVEIVGGEEFWEVECITKEKGKGATLKYFVKWKGFASSHNTWEPASEMIETAAEVVKEFKFKRKTLLS